MGFLSDAFDAEHGLFRDVIEPGQLGQFFICEDDECCYRLLSGYPLADFPEFREFFESGFVQYFSVIYFFPVPVRLGIRTLYVANAKTPIGAIVVADELVLNLQNLVAPQK